MFKTCCRCSRSRTASAPSVSSTRKAAFCTPTSFCPSRWAAAPVWAKAWPAWSCSCAPPTCSTGSGPAQLEMNRLRHRSAAPTTTPSSAPRSSADSSADTTEQRFKHKTENRDCADRRDRCLGRLALGQTNFSQCKFFIKFEFDVSQHKLAFFEMVALAQIF